MSSSQYRAAFDASITFSNGGDLTVHGFRVDVPSADVSEKEIAELFVASLGLLMTDDVQLANVSLIEEAHKGTRGGPSDRTPVAPGSGRLVELSHVIKAGMATYPGLPAPEITPHLTGEPSPGVRFTIDRLSLVGNTGTYMDSPYHYFPDRPDLSGIGLDQCADLPAVVIRAGAERGIDVDLLAGHDVRAAAVLLHTGDSARFGTPAYAENAHFLTRAAVEWLIAHGAALIGIDAVNIDDIGDLTRPAHSGLLAAGIPIVEHLTGLDSLPPSGARFTAVPLRIEAFGTIPVRAFARIP